MLPTFPTRQTTYLPLNYDPPTPPHQQVLQVLLERLRNEVTRLPAVRGEIEEGSSGGRERRGHQGGEGA